MNLLTEKLEEAQDALARDIGDALFNPKPQAETKRPRPSWLKRIGQRFTRWLMSRFDIYEEW